MLFQKADSVLLRRLQRGILMILMCFLQQLKIPDISLYISLKYLSIKVQAIKLMLSIRQLIIQKCLRLCRQHRILLQL